MARPNGVVIVSEHYWAFATSTGELHEGEMPKRRAAARIPLVRGLMQLAASMAPLVRGRGVAGSRERLFLLVVLLAPLGFVALPSRLELPAGLLSTALIILWLFRGRTLRLHGAEHRAIAAAEARSLEGTWSGTLRPSRFSPRCGTNFAALAIPVTTVFDRLAPSIAARCGHRRVRRRRLDRRHDGALEGGAASLRPAPRPAAARPRAAAADDEGARARGHASRAPGRCLRASPRALGGRLGRRPGALHHLEHGACRILDHGEPADLG